MQKALKRWMHATAILFAVMLIGANTGLAQVTVSLGEITGRPGDQAVIAVQLAGVESGAIIESFNFDIVADPGVTYTGFDDSGTLAGDNGFNTLDNPAIGRVAGVFQGTAISTSGTLIYLHFDLTAEGAGNVTLVNFTLNEGDPAVAGIFDIPFVVSTRIISVTMEHETRIGDAYTNSDQNFRILVNVEDALFEADEVLSFNFELHYDSALMTIGPGAVSTDGSFSPGMTASGNHPGGPGVFWVAGFSTGEFITGAGLLVSIAATATSADGEAVLRLVNAKFNEGDPIYATKSGTLLVLPFRIANEEETGLPTEFVLKGNYPNPFNPSTTLLFDLPESADVSIAVMDLLGRQVITIPTQAMSAGANRSVQVDAGALSSGIYLYRITANSRSNTIVKVGTMTLLK